MKRPQLSSFVGGAAQFWRIAREIDIRDLEQELQNQPSINLIADDSELLEGARALLFGRGDPLVRNVWLPGETKAPSADLDLVLLRAGRPITEAERRAILQGLSSGAPTLLVLASDAPPSLQPADGVLAEFPHLPAEHLVSVDLSDQRPAGERLVQVAVGVAPHLRLPLARRFPAFRKPVAQRLIRETSTANAQFALVSTLPAYVPLVGGLVGEMADIVVLTKNQVLLLFKLAGIYGRDLSDKPRLLAEVAPVVGGAFVWRSLARSLINLLPPFICAVPKTGVAFVGTYVVGQTARYYYDYGQRPPNATVQRFSEDGARAFRQVADRFRR